MSATTRTARLHTSDAILLLLVAVASATAVAGFHAVFVDWSFLPAAIAGALGGTLAVALAWRLRLLIGESIAISILAFGIVGVIVAGPIPGSAAVSALFDGLVNGWADILSLSPPADVTAELRVLPFALAWAGATVGGELLRRVSAPGAATFGPLVALAVSVLVTDEDRNVAVAQGVIIALSALTIGFAQFLRTGSRLARRSATHLTEDPPTDDDSLPDQQLGNHTGARSRRRIVRAALALGAVAIAAPIVGPRLPFADSYERFDLRDRNDPPWDPLSVASPLVQLKSEFKSDRREQVVFTIQSDRPVTRVNVAALGDFNGVVWTAGSTDGAAAASEFRPVGSSFPARMTDLETPADVSSATITIGEFDGPWLPAPAGWPVRATFEAGDAPEPPGADLRMNLFTGTLVVPSGVQPGFEYSVRFEEPGDSNDADLALAEIVPLLPSDEDDLLPPQIQNLTADIVQGVDRGWPQVAALRDRFVEQGFYDTSPDSRPGHSFFRVSEFLQDPDRLVGYEEQYAAAAAVVARSAQLPTRVIVGYRFPESRYDSAGVAQVVAEDISAWIEVDLGTRGWIPVDVTPDRSREPVEEASGVTIEDVATPSPPPPPQIPPKLEVLSAEEEPEEEEDEEEEDEEEDDEQAQSGGIGLAGGAAVAAGTVLGLAILAAIFIFVWKVTRRRRRRSSSDPGLRVGYAWREVLERYQEAGLEVADRSTPGEVMHTFVQSELTADEHEAELRSLVSVVQRSAYHFDPPATPDGDDAWQYHDQVVANLYQHQSVPKRMKMRLDPRTLRAPGWKQAANEQAESDT